MFYDVFTDLCERKGVSPNKALIDCGISRTSTAKWREGAIPRGVTLQKLADYFGVTTDYLLTGEDTKKAPSKTGEGVYSVPDKETLELLELLESREDIRYLAAASKNATPEHVKALLSHLIIKPPPAVSDNLKP